MKASDLATIQEPTTRFIQSYKFLKALEESRDIAIYVRDTALLELRGENKPLSYGKLAKLLGISKQRIVQMEQEARGRAKSSTIPRFSEWEHESEETITGTDN
jgi:hypothetical protein